MKYIILTFVFGIYSCSNVDKNEHKYEYLRHVGDIPFDSKLDNPEFEPCHEDLSFVHYNFNNPDLYEGEKPAIIKAFKTINLVESPKNTGYITIRFMVNCKGQTGRFRVEQLDMNYKPKKFDNEIMDSILSTTKSLDGWLPATYDNKEFDYYKYLTFKIVDNKIIDILP